MAERFSKAKLRAYCQEQMEQLQVEFHRETRRRIDLRNGTSQVKGLSAEAGRIFGAWDAHRWILNRLEWGDL